MDPFRAVIGLEVHAQLKTRSKLFCACAVGFGGDANSRVCETCLGLPGALPLPNREAVRLAVRIARALSCDVHPTSTWARKNYFYPDLPKGYQVSQYERPLATGGRLRIEPPGTAPRWIPLTRIHLEEDAGKSLHEGFGEARSGIDLNRCGAPLIEIVTEPELRSPDEAGMFLERLRSWLRATAVSDADMEKGLMRCDANVSVHPASAALGTPVEIKNLNSFRHVRRALSYEIARQRKCLRKGERVVRETRLWDESSAVTRPMRSKEQAHDYRYFPDPDLPPLELDEDLVAAAVEAMPDPPHARRDRYVAEWGLREQDAHRLTVDHELAGFFEAVATRSGNPRAAANWVLAEWLGLIHETGRSIAESPVGADALASLIALVETGAISGRAGKELLRDAAATGRAPADLVDERGLRQLDDAAVIEAVCRDVLAHHPAQAAAVRAGRKGVLGYLVGQVMRETAGRANPPLVNAILTRLLS